MEPYVTITLRDATPEELAIRAKRKAQQDAFETEISEFDSGVDYEKALSLQERLDLVELAQDCAYDGNGPAHLEGCFKLIAFVENLR